MPGQPAFGGVAFTTLLFRSVLGRHEFGRQWQDAGVTWCHDGSAQEGVEIFSTAVRTPPGRAALAVDLARAGMFSPVQRDQGPAAEAPEGREHAFGGRTEDRMPPARRRRA